MCTVSPGNVQGDDVLVDGREEAAEHVGGSLAVRQQADDVLEGALPRTRELHLRLTD